MDLLWFAQKSASHSVVMCQCFASPCSVIPQTEVASVGVLVEFGRRIRSEMSPMLVKQFVKVQYLMASKSRTNAEKTYIL